MLAVHDVIFFCLNLVFVGGICVWVCKVNKCNDLIIFKDELRCVFVLCGIFLIIQHLNFTVCQFLCWRGCGVWGNLGAFGVFISFMVFIIFD